MKTLKKYISPILTVLILSLFAIYLVKNPKIIDELLNTNPLYILLIMSLYLFVFFLEGVFIIVTLSIFDRDISKTEGWYIATVSRIGNYLLPMRAGAIFRATYLKKKFNFPYSKFLSTLYGYYIIFFLTNSLLALLVLILKSFFSNTSFISLILFFSLIVIGMLILIFLKIPLKEIIKTENRLILKIVNFFDKFLKGWELIANNKKTLFKLLLLSIANILVNVLIIYIQFVSIEKVAKILDVILYTCLSGVSLLASITPGSLGIREGIFLLTSKSIGLTESEIMQLAFLDRGIMFVLLLLCIGILYIFFKKFNLKEVFFGKRKDIQNS